MMEANSAVLAACAAMIHAARRHVLDHKVKRHLPEILLVILPVKEGNFSDIRKDPAINKVALDRGKHPITDVCGKAGGGQA
jgi:hypothetical protein